ncbi:MULTISPECIES: DUF4185 domain-containing protein [unclassified Gordonia (in: high G+C Gram-positive bacteria)]|uniref:DUF4185 domain-containing protein n=1 Tax=unclassified Gordonia (in: high G+C Gram-positive bacteria) TaxID=2657482 RepID=UPI001F0E9EAA|nr:DUF4185 domain-containing protein [Gordonia sp. ABSL49_1]MCH5645238.1 DUF4185 domain-containing protein [Gordonia sp. ABSL49_1]
MAFWRRESPAANSAIGGMKVANLTGPGCSDDFGVGAADLGAMVQAPNGKIVAVFGDTYRDARAGSPDWRSPVILVGHRDPGGELVWEHAGGPDPDYARQLWPYTHDSPPWRRGGFSTVIPSDVLRVGDDLFLHAMVIKGFPRVAWSEIWRSSDNGVTWGHMGRHAGFAAGLHDGLAQSWTWDYDPDDGWVYVISTVFQAGSGMILRRVRPADIGDRDRYVTWGFQDGRWAWGVPPTVITPPGELWRETTFRRLRGEHGVGWVLGGFCISDRGLSYRVLERPTDDVGSRVKTMPISELSDWSVEDHPGGRVAQAYGGYIIPGSTLDVPNGIGIAVSQWNTRTHWPYRVMQFQTTLHSPPARSAPHARLAQRVGDWQTTLESVKAQDDLADLAVEADRALDRLRRAIDGSTDA